MFRDSAPALCDHTLFGVQCGTLMCSSTFMCFADFLCIFLQRGTSTLEIGSEMSVLGPEEGGGAARMLRRAAAGSALLALACVVAVVLTSADVGFEALLAQAKLPSREPAAVDPGHTEQLHWGHKWLKSHHYNHPHYWGGAGCEHDFRDLCNENYYHHNVHPFLLHHKWLDGSERLEQAHKFDEEEETAFQEATKELHNKVLVEREDWNAEMKELHEEKQVVAHARRWCCRAPPYG